jgi:hypothetical protein
MKIHIAKTIPPNTKLIPGRIYQDNIGRVFIYAYSDTSSFCMAVNLETGEACHPLSPCSYRDITDYASIQPINKKG